MNIYMYVCKHICIYVCTHVCIYSCARVFVYVYYIRMCSCTCACVYYVYSCVGTHLCVMCIQPIKVWAYEYRGAIARWTAQWHEEHAQGLFKHYVPIKSSLLVEAFASPYALLSRDYERLEILGL